MELSRIRSSQATRGYSLISPTTSSGNHPLILSSKLKWVQINLICNRIPPWMVRVLVEHTLGYKQQLGLLPMRREPSCPCGGGLRHWVGRWAHIG
jgi:hypothetical protein